MADFLKSCCTEDGFLHGFVFCRTEPGRLKDTNLGGVRFVGKALDGFVYVLDGLRRMPGKPGSGLDLFEDRRGTVYGAFVDPYDRLGTFRYGPVWENADWYVRAYFDMRMLAADLSKLAGAARETVELELACLGVGT